MLATRARSRLPAGSVALLFVILACTFAATGCSSEGEPFVPNIDAHRIVLQNAKSSFEVFLDTDKHRAPLEAFFQATASAQKRADLLSAWAAVPKLAEEGAAFLTENVFDAAEKDGDWPEDPPDEKASFVDGTRDAVTAFLAGE